MKSPYHIPSRCSNPRAMAPSRRPSQKHRKLASCVHHAGSRARRSAPCGDPSSWAGERSRSKSVEPPELPQREAELKGSSPSGLTGRLYRPPSKVGTFDQKFGPSTLFLGHVPILGTTCKTYMFDAHCELAAPTRRRDEQHAQKQ